jgi:hypothetical protein
MMSRTRLDPGNTPFHLRDPVPPTPVQGAVRERARPDFSGLPGIPGEKERADLPQGRPSEGMHVVVMGQVKLALPSAQGMEKVVHMCGPGITFGEAVVFLDKPYPVSPRRLWKACCCWSPSGAPGRHGEQRHALPQDDGQPVRPPARTAGRHGNLHAAQQRAAGGVLPGPGGAIGRRLATRSTCQASKQTWRRSSIWRRKPFPGCWGNSAEAGLMTVKGRTIAVLDRQKLADYSA